MTKRLADYAIMPEGKNPRRQTKRGADLLSQSVEQNGIADTVFVAADDSVIHGNHRAQTIADVYGVDVPIIEVKTNRNTLVVVKLTDVESNDTPEARRMALALNRSGEVGEYDPLVLAEYEPAILADYFFKEELEVMLEGEVLAETDQSNYSRKIEPPIYEPSPNKPAIASLFDDSKTQALIKAIEASTATDEEKRFLTLAAYRHTVFNFDKIADWYAHSPATMQRLAEDSALVIVDFNRAIELGFVELSKKLGELFEVDYPNE
jgi:hypothetical protein